MAEKFPSAQCIGLDLSKVPKLRPHEQNVRFLRGNVMTQKPIDWEAYDGAEKLSQDVGMFDYIFSRLLILGMPDWAQYIQREYELLRPGGWVEVHDLDWNWYDRNDNIINTDWGWLQTLIDTLEKEEKFNLHCGSGAQKWMKEAGFVDIQVFEYRWPFGGYVYHDSTAMTITGRQIFHNLPLLFYVRLWLTCTLGNPNLRSRCGSLETTQPFACLPCFIT